MSDLASSANGKQIEPVFAATIWAALIAALSVGGSLFYACATPFAAIATLAGTKLERNSGLAVLLLAWATNQFVGYTMLNYPVTASSVAWGGAIGIAAVAGLHAARMLSSRMGGVGFIAVAFTGSFAAYEGVLYATGLILGGAQEAFTSAIVLQIFKINAISLVALLVLYRIALALSLLPSTPRASPSAPQSR